MSIRSLNIQTMTAAPFADAANLTDAQHLSIQGSTASERLVVQELYVGGLAPSASSPMQMVFCRHSTVGATLSLTATAKDANLDATGATGTARGYNTATTKPQRSATLGLLSAAFNAFGGNWKWQPSGVPGKDISTLGTGTTFGEAGLSNGTGGTSALVGGHILYEVM